MLSKKGGDLHFFVEDTIAGLYGSQYSSYQLAFEPMLNAQKVTESETVTKPIDSSKEVEKDDTEEEVEESSKENEETEKDENISDEAIVEELPPEPNSEMSEKSAATGEEPENEGGEGIAHPHDPDQADVFDIDYDLDFDSAPPLVVVFLDDDLINEFYQETVSEDTYLTPQSSGSPISPGTDTYHSVGNTLLDVSNNMIQNFNQIAPFQLQLQPQKIALFDDDVHHPPHQRDPFDVPAVSIIGSVLANDQGLGLMVTGLKNITEGAFVQMEADGTFKYVPPPGFSDATDSFEYMVQDLNGNITTGQVNIVLSNTVWYVDNTDIKMGGLGTGTALDPFTSLNIFLGEERPDGPNDTIFIRTGTGIYQSGDGNRDLQLLVGQKLVGEGAPLVIDDILIRSQGIAPILENNDFIKSADVSGIDLVPRSIINILPDFSEPVTDLV